MRTTLERFQSAKLFPLKEQLSHHHLSVDVSFANENTQPCTCMPVYNVCLLACVYICILFLLTIDGSVHGKTMRYGIAFILR